MRGRNYRAVAAAVGLFGFAASAAAASYTWNGGAYNTDWYGQFNVSGPFWSNNWGQVGLAPLATPQAADIAVIGSAFISELGATASVDSLHLADTAQFTIQQTGDLSIGNSLTVDAGATFTSAHTWSVFTPPSVITNNGTMRLAAVMDAPTKDVLLQGTGANYFGEVAANVQMTVHSFTVSAETYVTTNGTIYDCIVNNNGTMAVYSGASRFRGALNNNGGIYVFGGQLYLGGVVTQADTSAIYIGGGTVFASGTMGQDVWVNGGKILKYSSGGASGTLYLSGSSKFHLGVTRSDVNIAMPDGARIYLESDVVNNGRIGLEGYNETDLAHMIVTGNRTLNGSGLLDIRAGDVNGSAPGYTLTNGLDHIIEARIGTVSTSLDNRGVIRSVADGKTLTLSGLAIANSGRIQAQYGSNMVIGGTGKQVNQTSLGQIIANASSVTFLPGTSITGGTVGALGTGSVTADDTVSFTGVTLTGDGQFYGVTNLLSGSKLNPGNSPGRLSFGTLQITGEVLYNYEFTATEHDEVLVGALDFAGGSMLVHLTSLDGSAVPSDITLFVARTTVEAPNMSDIKIEGYTYEQLLLNGGYVTLHNVQVPEPTALACLGLMSLFVLRRRR